MDPAAREGAAFVGGDAVGEIREASPVIAIPGPGMKKQHQS
jgi:hypothetical protein